MKTLMVCNIFLDPHFSDWDFDSPNSYDYDLLLETITKLKQGRTVDVPIYDFETHKRYRCSSALMDVC